VKNAEIERRRDSIDRVRSRRDELLRRYNLDEDEFKLVCRLVDDQSFRERVTALTADLGFIEIREQWNKIWLDEYEHVEVRCQSCGEPGANYRRRPIGTFCDACVEAAFDRPSTPPSNGIRSALARARRAGLPATLTEAEWTATVAHFNDRCALCGGPWSVVEHATSISLGGGTTAANCYPACVHCNNEKRSTELEYMDGERIDATLEWLRSQGRIRRG
jgi:5-methylcytosine-specific restriction endonuclease McrA